MPVLLLLFVAAGLLLWLHLRGRSGLARSSGPIRSSGQSTMSGKSCEWQKQGRGAGLQAFQCKTCGQTAYSTHARGPQECKRDLKSGTL
ncbi:MAG TPA: hypothetical protein PLH11_10195 [Gemmobacter sp.]|nr:hypothetical protein [Gemmobacter sp.]